MVTSWLTSPPLQARDMEYLDEMRGYIDLSRDFVNALGQREFAVFFAIEGIVEIYEERDELRDAIIHLERILARYPDDVAVRNIIRFKIQELYRILDLPGKAMDQLDLIIAESQRLDESSGDGEANPGAEAPSTP
ncbi:MAG: hypothetical protein ACFCBW_07885 [Candidatus Competibacterales bacterium]